MAEEFKTQGEPLREEAKLGPNVTYNPPPGEAQVIQYAGVTMRAGQSVNLVELLGEPQARERLKKLAGNRFFQVDGGPKQQSHEEQLGQQDKLLQMQALTPSVLDAERRARLQGQEPPEDYQAPLEPVLERPNLPRGNQARQSEPSPPPQGQESQAQEPDQAERELRSRKGK